MDRRTFIATAAATTGIGIGGCASGERPETPAEVLGVMFRAVIHNDYDAANSYVHADAQGARWHADEVKQWEPDKTEIEWITKVDSQAPSDKVRYEVALEYKTLEEDIRRAFDVSLRRNNAGAWRATNIDLPDQ